MMGKAMRYVTRADGTFAPDPTGQDGQPMVVLGVKDRYGELVDLVAWHPDAPERWYLRIGDETPILGGRTRSPSPRITAARSHCIPHRRRGCMRGSVTATMTPCASWTGTLT